MPTSVRKRVPSRTLGRFHRRKASVTSPSAIAWEKGSFDQHSVPLYRNLIRAHASSGRPAYRSRQSISGNGILKGIWPTPGYGLTRRGRWTPPLLFDPEITGRAQQRAHCAHPRKMLAVPSRLKIPTELVRCSISQVSIRSSRSRMFPSLHRIPPGWRLKAVYNKLRGRAPAVLELDQDPRNSRPGPVCSLGKAKGRQDRVRLQRTARMNEPKGGCSTHSNTTRRIRKDASL